MRGPPLLPKQQPSLRAGLLSEMVVNSPATISPTSKIASEAGHQWEAAGQAIWTTRPRPSDQGPSLLGPTDDLSERNASSESAEQTRPPAMDIAAPRRGRTTEQRVESTGHRFVQLQEDRHGPQTKAKEPTPTASNPRPRGP